MIEAIVTDFPTMTRKRICIIKLCEDKQSKMKLCNFKHWLDNVIDRKVGSMFEGTGA